MVQQSAGGRSGLRARAVIGVFLALVGAYFAFDPRERLALILDARGYWWVVFAALTTVLLIQTIPSIAGRVLILFFGTIAVVGIVGLPAIQSAASVNLLPVAIGVGGVGLVLTAVKGRRDRVVSVLWMRRRHAARGALAARIELVCVAAGLRLNLCSATLTGGQSLHVRMLAGEVEIAIPREWCCEVTAARMRGVVVRERGPIPQDGPTLHLEISALVGLLVISRI